MTGTGTEAAQIFAAREKRPTLRTAPLNECEEENQRCPVQQGVN